MLTPAIKVAAGSSSMTIKTLQAGRALAALAVVFLHAVESAVAFTNGTPDWIRQISSFGYLGVDFFFVLSGFIMAHIHDHDRQISSYARSRMVRVFVPYLPIGLAMAAIYTLAPGLSAGAREWTWLASASLLPGTGEPALIVAWTLQFELLFYAVFGAFLALRRPLLGVALWAAVAAVCYIFADTLNGTQFVGLIVIEFLFGMIAAGMVRNGFFRHTALAAFVAFFAYVLMGATESNRTIFALATAFAIVGFVRAEQRGVLVVPKIFLFLGGASYSIYLVHNPVAALMARLTDTWWVAIVTGVTVGTAMGIAYHLLVERPALALFQRKRIKHCQSPKLVA